MSAREADPLAEMSPIDPADYPHRFTLMPEDPPPGAQVAIVWQALPWPAELVSHLLAVLIGGGGIALIARTAGELVRAREFVEGLVGPAPVRSGGELQRRHAGRAT